MRIALYHPDDNPESAEIESAQRFIMAAQHIGHDASLVQRAYQIRAMQPDFVICMSYQAPKITQFPTYGILNGPTDHFEYVNRYIHNILSYDGYLTFSTHVEEWIDDYLSATRKRKFIANFTFTCHETSFKEPHLDCAELAYVGTNWDEQHRSLFKELSQRDFMQCYGPLERWEYISSKARRGIIPFDGISKLDAYNNAGVGLCLHSNAFRMANVPTKTIFEICASGAVLICDRLPIVEKIFGDTVLYVDNSAPPLEQLKQIQAHMSWIKSHQRHAKQIARNANRIFTEHYSMEKLIPHIVNMHKTVVQKKGYLSIPPVARDSVPLPTVSIIVRTGGRQLIYLQRCLDSISMQTWPNLEVIIVNYKKVEGLEALLLSYGNRFSVRHCESLGGHAGTTLWAGLNAVKQPYFAILDDDDRLHPNHIAGLMDWMNRSPDDVGLVYTGVLDILETPLNNTESEKYTNQLLWPLEKDNEGQTIYRDDTRLVHFHPFDPHQFTQGTNCVAPNAFIAKTSLLDEHILEDPNAPRGEDYLLVLLLFSKCKFIFTWELSAEHRERAIPGENSQYWHPKVIKIANAKIRRRLFGRYYHAQDFAFGPALNPHADSLSPTKMKWTWETVHKNLFDYPGNVSLRRRVLRIVKEFFFK